MREILDQLQRQQNERCAPLDFHRGFSDAIARVRAALEGVEPLPDGLDLPADGEAAYRTMTAGGFTLRADKAWLAPDDEPLTTEQMMAVATLQEYGFGSVVSA